MAFRRSVVGRRGTIYTPAMLLLTITVGISYLGLGFMLPLRAWYGRHVGASSVEIGLMASSALLAGILAAPLIGWLADRFGHGAILWMGLLAHAVLVLIYIPVQDPVALIGLRALEGIAMTSVLPPARALMNALAPRDRQGEALGLLSAAQMVGILLGPVAGTLLASQLGATPSFLAASAPLLLGAITAKLFLPRRAEGFHHESDAVRAGRALLRELFTGPLTLAYLLRGVLAVTQGIGAAIWTLYMLDRGASLPLIGLSFTLYAIPAVLFAPVVGRFTDRRGRYWPVLSGLAIYTVIYAIYGVGVPPMWLVIGSTVEGVASAIARTSVDGLLADVMPMSLKGRVQANYSAANDTGSLFGATAAGFLYALTPGAPFFMLSALFGVTALALFFPAVIRLFASARSAPTLAA